jgi:hypothetical protein
MLRSKPIRRTATVACCAILAGVGAAGARALEVPSLPTPTLPTPTVSTPTVPLPAPTTTAPSLPAPVPTVPTVTSTPSVTVPLPTPTPSLPAPIGSSPSPGGTTGGTDGGLLGGVTGSVTGTSSSSPLGASSSGSAATSGGAAALEGTRPGEKFVTVAATATQRRPGVVTVRFRLARARRVIVILRGPLPSCNPTARYALRGRRGTNAVRFDGTVGKQRLKPGSYLLGIKPVTGSTVRWAAVHVGPRGAQPLPRRIVRPALGQCSSTTASRALLVGRFDSTPTATGGTAGAEATKVKPPQPVERVPAPEASVLPFLGIQEAAAELPSALGYFLLAILGGSLLGVSVFVVRFLRSPST